jgi:hypothetical protein
VAPLRLGGLRGKESTPSVWLGGTGEFSTVGKREQFAFENLDGCVFMLDECLILVIKISLEWVW